MLLEAQYLILGERIIKNGVMIPNKRTGVGCLTVINADIEIDASTDKAPVLTTRKVPYLGGIGEFIAYLQGKTNAADFRELGCRNWDANANENKAWLANPHRKGEDDLGNVYGAVGRDWVNQYGVSFDLLKQVIDDLSKGIDNRGEIVTWWNPGEFEYGCLRPCMHSHQFSILDGVLYLNSTSRSADVPLGLPANIMQCYLFLRLMAQITGLKPGTAYLKIVNAHIYENQIALFKEQLTRKMITEHQPTLYINPDIKSLEGIMGIKKGDISVEGYESFYPAIKYPFTV